MKEGSYRNTEFIGDDGTYETTVNVDKNVKTSISISRKF